jgi:hypothetical protein
LHALKPGLKDEMTMRTYRLLFASLLAAAALHGRGAQAQDDGEDSDERDATCTAGFDRGRVNGTLNVVGRCQLTRADVRGDVILFAGGSLIARGGRIRGSLEGSRADFVDLDDVRVDGNVSLQELVGDSSNIESSDIRGNVVLTGNRSRFEIVDNELHRDVTALGNTGGLQIAGNTISGDLECSGNAPAPTLLGNRIDGDAEGQCAAPRPAAEPPRGDDPPTPAPAPRPPAAAPPSTPAPPATTASPPAAPAPAATTAPPAATTPPAASPPAAAATDTALVDDGGAGAIGWPTISLLLPLLALRRRRRRGF